MTTQELYNEANSLCNSLDSHIKSMSREIGVCGADTRFIRLGKLNEAYEKAADTRELLSEVNHNTPAGQ